MVVQGHEEPSVSTWDRQESEAQSLKVPDRTSSVPDTTDDLGLSTFGWVSPQTLHLGLSRVPFEPVGENPSETFPPQIPFRLRLGPVRVCGTCVSGGPSSASVRFDPAGPRQGVVVHRVGDSQNTGTEVDLLFSRY